MRHFILLLVLIWISSCLYGQQASVLMPEELHGFQPELSGADSLDGERFIFYGHSKHFNHSYNTPAGPSAFWGIYHTDQRLEKWIRTDSLSEIAGGIYREGQLILAGYFSMPFSPVKKDGFVMIYDTLGVKIDQLRFPRGMALVEHSLVECHGGRTLMVHSKGIIELSDLGLTEYWNSGGLTVQNVFVWKDDLYFLTGESLYHLDSNQVSSFVSEVSGAGPFVITSEGQLYLLRNNDLMYREKADSSEMLFPLAFAKHRSIVNLDLVDEGQRVRLVYQPRNSTSVLSQVDIYQGTSLEDRFVPDLPQFALTNVMTMEGGIIAFGMHSGCFGYFTDGGFVHTTEDREVVDSQHDLGIEMVIDSSYWVRDTQRPGPFETHYWDVTIVVTNHGDDAINQAYLEGKRRELSTQGFDIYSADFMGPLKKEERLILSNTYHSSANRRIENDFCLSVDIPDGRLDMDYSNNCICRELPNPTISSQKDHSDDRLSVYPNPASDYIHIKNVPLSAKLVVYNALGELLHQKDSQGVSEEEIYIGDLKNGMYWVGFISKNGQKFYQKIIKATP